MLWIIASRNLLQAKRRTLLLSAAIGGVTLLLVLLLSLVQGLTETLIRSATTLSAGHINVGGFYKSTSADAAPLITNVAELQRIVEENTPELDYVVARHKGWARVISETGSLHSGLSGIHIADEPHFATTIQLAAESEYRSGGRAEILGDVRRLAEPKTAMVFAAQAKRLEVTVGDAITIMIETLDGRRNTTDVTIVAVGKDIGMMSNWSLFVPRETILELYQLQKDTSGALFVYLKDIDEAEKTMVHLRHVFEEKGYKLMDHEAKPFWSKFERVAGEDWLGQRIDLTLWRDEVSFVEWVFTALQTVSFCLLSVLVVIIVIGIMNSTYISVRERTREIGTIRAIGMSRLGVLSTFMMEALLLALFATTLGGLLGAAIASIVDAAHIAIPIEAVQAILMTDTLHLSVHATQVAIASAVFSSVTMLAALWPALRASRLAPMDAIHAIG